MQQISPNVSCLAKATRDQTALAGSKVRLFTTITSVDAQTVLSELVANEADFTGYPAGGKTQAAWLGPILVPQGGASIYTPNIIWNWDGALPGTTNSITGWFVVLADGVTLWECGTFENAIPITGPGDGFIMTLEQNQPN